MGTLFSDGSSTAACLQVCCLAMAVSAGFTVLAFSKNGTILLFISTANGYLPSGSGTTIRHNTQITHITQK
jgi:hypothetical protein